jgi:hypothetical protein
VTLDHTLAELAQSFAPDRVTAQDLKFKAALQSFLSGPRNASGVSPAAMSAAVSLQMDVLPLAFGVLPAVQALVLAVVSQRTNLAARPRFDGWAG